MRVVLGIHRLAEVVGTETYLGTLAEHLQELGHEVTVFSPVVGIWGRELERRGLVVADDERRLPGECDAVLPQDTITAFLLADRYPAAPQLQGVHAHVYQIHSPTQLPGMTAAVVGVQRHGRTEDAGPGEPAAGRAPAPADRPRAVHPARGGPAPGAPGAGTRQLVS
jgi:hypothetical protein